MGVGLKYFAYFPLKFYVGLSSVFVVIEPCADLRYFIILICFFKGCVTVFPSKNKRPNVS